MQDEAIKLLEQLIAIPSISREEEKVATLLFDYMQDKDLCPQRVGNNIFCSTVISDSMPTILLNAHIDTVKPCQGWTYNPYNPEIIDGKLYGLGSNDCGGGLVALLYTFIALRDKEIPYNLVFAASCEEEVSGKNGFESLLPHLPKIDVAIVGEPTSMQPAICEKGLMVVDVTTHGKAGHAARTEGVNALYIALDDISWIRNYHFPKQSSLLGETRMNVTILNCGTQHNCIPDTCTYTIDVRTTECYSNQEVLTFLQSKLQGDVKARSTRLNSSFISDTHPLIQRCIEQGLQPFGSPTLSDQALMPFPSFKLGPGDSSRSHTANEYIEIKEIERAIALYKKVLE